MRFSCDVCLLPFNHPIRLAEDLAVLDNISNGRVEVGIGMGYAPHEFRGFGLPVSRRVSLIDEGLTVLRRAFTGEAFSFEGKRYTFQDVKITPGYVQNGGPPLWVVAMAEAGAERAARFGEMRIPQTWVIGDVEHCVAELTRFIREYGFTISSPGPSRRECGPSRWRRAWSGSRATWRRG